MSESPDVRPCDVAVIGGGVVGSAVLRELSRYRLRSVLLEARSDLAEGVSKGNSGVIHAGFNVPTGSLKARANAAGLRMTYRLAGELGVPHRKTGKLVVAFDDRGRRRLEGLKRQGDQNGVPGLEIVDEDAIRTLEPRVRGRWALFSPWTGIISPYEFTIALAECAGRNGASIFLDSPLTAVAAFPDGYELATPRGLFRTRWVVNCAGLRADEVAALAGSGSFRIQPVRGEYLVLDKEAGSVLRTPVYPAPPEDGFFLGIHLTPTIEGNILLGPSAEWVGDKDDAASTREIADRLKAEACGLVPDLSRFPVIHAYAGLRPRLVSPDGSASDFVLAESGHRPRWIDIAGIESPGLTAAPALAAMVADLIGSKEPLNLKEDFEAGLDDRPRFASLGDAARAGLAAAEADWGDMVCRCEHVTRAEVLRAVRAPLGARTLDAVKRRTRCGMGRCQGGFCTPRIVDLLQDEGAALEELTKKGGSSRLSFGRIAPGDGPRRPPKPPSNVSAPDSPATDRCDVAVIGGGPAGLAAALGARRAGADVLVVEREPRLGGILNQCIHDGFGLFLYRESVSGPEYAERLAEEAGREGVRFETGAMVLDLSKDLALRINARSGYRTIRPRAVILAMGCRERTREMIGIPGDRPAGVLTAGSAQNLVNIRNVRIGREAVILGSGDVGLIMARRLTFEGIRVKGVFEILPWASGLERNVRQCLMDFGIPLELQATVTEIRGRERVSSVVVARVDEGFRPVPGTEREIPCDTLLLSAGLIPENELSKRAGVILSSETGGAVVDQDFMTTVPGIFSCGNVLHIHDVADWASFEGFAAGKSAADFALGRRMPEGEAARIEPGPGLRYVLPQIIRKGAAGADLYFRVKTPGRKVRLEARGRESGKIVFRKAFPRAVPSELLKIRLKAAVEEDLEVRVRG